MGTSTFLMGAGVLLPLLCCLVPSRAAMALPPLPPGLGVEEAVRYLASEESQCDLPRLEDLPSEEDFVATWQHQPFVIAAAALQLPKFQINALRKAEPAKKVRVVLDPEYGMLSQRRAAGYYDCRIDWKGFVEYWALPADRLSESKAARTALDGCGPPKSEGVMPKKRTFYGRHDGEPLKELLLPALSKVPFYNWRASERKELNAWISTQGARTPMHLDNYYQAFVQLRGEKFLLLAPPNTSDALFAAAAQWPGLPDRASSSEWRPASTAEAEEPLYFCKLRQGESLWLPARWPHDVFTLTDSLTTILRWDTPFLSRQEL